LLNAIMRISVSLVLDIEFRSREMQLRHAIRQRDAIF
jgi:hypothetical protein